MPAHPCLETPEIQAQIFEHHAEDPQTLLALALTCQSWTDSALDFLWREQSNLVWLVRTMSPKGDLWDAPEGSKELRQMRFKRGIEKIDMERFLYYSHRIRHLRLEQRTTVDLPLHILSSLTAYKPGQALLPRINRLTLRFDEGTNEYISYLPALLNNSLADFELRIWLKFNLDGTRAGRSPVTAQNLQTLLEALATTAPSIHSFKTLFIPAVHYGYSHLFESFITALPNLKNLSCKGLKVMPALLQYLGSKDLLKLNDVHLDTLSRTDPISVSLFGPSRFTFLEELRLLPLPLDWLTLMLEALESPLRKLFLAINNEASNVSQSRHEKLCSAIAKFKQLMSLSVQSDAPNNIPPQILTPSPLVFSQLLGLHHLEAVIIRFSCVEELDPPILSQVPAAWPSITRLSISLATPYDNASPKVTLKGLATMTSRCTQLKYLSIAADLRPFQITRPLAVGNESVEEAFFYNSTLSSNNILSVIRCICIMFPSATLVEGDGRGGGWEVFRELAEDFFQPVAEC